MDMEHDENKRDDSGLQEKQALPSPVCIIGTDVESVQTYRYLGVNLANKVEW